MADVIISDLPEIITSTNDDYFIINDGNATTAIISHENLIGSIVDLQNVGFADGTALAPSISFTSDPNVGIYRPGPDSWAVSTNGIQRLVIDSAGKVGINQSSPGAWFNGSNNLVVGDPSLGDNGITIASSTTDVGNISFADGTGAADSRSGLIRYDHTDDHMRFDTASFERMRIDEDGNIGIGTSDPTTILELSSSDPRLTIRDTDNPDRYTQLRNSGGNTYLSNLSSGSIIFGAPDEKMRIQDDGNILIGGTLPASPNIELKGSDGSIAAAGIITAAGDIISGDLDQATGGSRLNANGSISIRKDTGTGVSGNAFNVYSGGTNLANITASISKEGSITAAGTVTVGDNPGEVDKAGVRIYSSGSIALSRGTNETDRLFGVLDKNGNPTVEMFPNGSITAEGSIETKGNINLTGAGTPGPQLSTPAANTIALTPGSVERIRVDESGAIGLSGANYGLDGQVLSSQGPGVAPAWVSIASGVPDITTLDYLP